ncbi:dihydroorotate dehydrogenase [Candidatus Acetothermia bacterium]|nr:dihydroorotate dehydrogenase [Candidatus Acetothermia bacterium]
MMLEINLCGMRLKNPLILASGILGTGNDILRRVAECNIGAVTTKSMGLVSRPGYSGPSIVATDCGYLNAMGLPNPGVKVFAAELARWDKHPAAVPLIASIYGSTPAEAAEVAAIIAPVAAAIEINLSCPHASGYGLVVGSDPQSVEKIVYAVRQAVQIPILAKLSPAVADITIIGKAAESGGADALVAINTLPAMAIDITLRRPLLGNITGGLSGPAIRPIAIRAVYELYKAVNIPIIGSGGIVTGEDAIEFILAGATAVQIGTGIAYKGLTIFTEIEERMRRYLQQERISLAELVGLAHRMSL